MEFRSRVQRIADNAKLIENPSDEDLRKLAKHDEITTNVGSPSYISKIRSRSKKFTEIIEDNPTQDQLEFLDKLENYLKDKELIMIDRTLCQNPRAQIPCRVLISKKYARIVYMWKHTLFPAINKDPLFLTVYIPEFQEQPRIIVYPKEYVTFIVGTDYVGECKMANLRFAMYKWKQEGGLGFHAGSKSIHLKDNNGIMQKKGVIIFGLSGTGKTTLTIHEHGLIGEEGVEFMQDDIILIDDSSYCFGTEHGFYIKTIGLSDKEQPILYNATMKPHAILENVYVKNGLINFDDGSLTTNGRATIQRSDIKDCVKTVDLEKVDIIIFNTRRNDILPPVAKLNTVQAAATFMLGESIKTSAGDPEHAGESVRVVGFNPFIIGPKHIVGNKFLEILEKNPHIQCFVLNTGHIGDKDKITVNDSSSIIKEIARNSIIWKKDPTWDYEIPVEVPGVETKKLDPINYYSMEEYQKRVIVLKEERKNYLAQFPELKKEIKEVFLFNFINSYI